MTTHEELTAELRRFILQQPGQRLPPERDLAQQLGISRSSLRTLLDTLAAEGLISRRQGSGTYAEKPPADRLRTVALLIDGELKLGEDPFFSLLVERLQSHLQEAGIACVIERLRGQESPLSRFDGALVCGWAGEAILANRKPGDSPMVGLLLTASLPPHAQVSLFQLADEEAGQEAVRHLVAAGCHDLLFIGRRDLPSSRARLQGAAEAAKLANIQLDFIGCHLNYAAGLRLGRDLPLREKTTGIIAANDWLAVGLRAGLAQNSVAGLKPQIVSFDGLPISADALFAIDSLEVPLDTIAVDAIRELQRLCQPVPMAGRVVRYGLSWRSR